MNIITAAVIGAVRSGEFNSKDSEIGRAYACLTDRIQAVYGAKSDLSDIIGLFERKPDSERWAGELEKEMSAKSEPDAELLTPASEILRLIGPERGKEFFIPENVFKKEKKPGPKVFISYAREDIDTAKKLFADLKRGGADPWMDTEKLLSGEKWTEVIGRVMRESRFVLSLLSEKSVRKKGYFQKELNMALDIEEKFPEGDIFLIPVRLNNCTLPDKLRSIHLTDLFPNYYNGLIKIFNTLYKNDLPSDLDQKLHPEHEALKIYRRMLVKDLQHLPLRGLNLDESDPCAGKKGFQLEQVYVELDTTSHVELSEDEANALKKKGELDGRERPRILSALEASRINRRLVILGEPGSGKSTFVNHLTLGLAAGDAGACRLDALSQWPEDERRMIPIHVVLRDFALWIGSGEQKPEAGVLWGFIVNRLKAWNLEAAEGPLADALDRGKAILLLDGLDEIPVKEKRGFVRDAAAAFVERYESIRCIVTCRKLSYQDPAWKLSDFPVVELAPFDEKKIKDFIRAWYEDLRRQGVVKTETESETLSRKLREAALREDLRRLAQNPLLLTVMALVHTHEGALPDARALLYEKAINILLWRWEQIKVSGGNDLPRIRELLREAGRADVDLKIMLNQLAYQVHAQPGGQDADQAAGISEKDLSKALTALHPTQSKDWADQMIRAIKTRAGLLVERTGEVYAFPHRTFQEYLAGAHLSSQGNFAIKAAKLAGEGSFWRVVILLAVGRLVYLSNDCDKPLALVAELCSKTGDNETAWRSIWLAGEVLLEIGVNRVQDRSLGRDMMERIKGKLVELIQSGQLEPAERVSAGNVLSLLGDPRFNPNMYFLPDDEMLGFVEIPAGSFLMGSDEKRDKEAYSRELPQHTVELSSYYISRYPVTAAQFKVFVKETGHQTDEEWEDYNRYDNHPAVMVSWNEAVEYCKWLTEKLKDRGWQIRLATEAQWEKAARGRDGRIYPWGDRFDPNKLNGYKTGIRTTSPAGCFPCDISPYGILDMSGNVCEWCQDWYDSDYYQKSPPEDPAGPDDGSGRVIRGGAWDDDAGLCRTAYRVRGDPARRGVDLGFRLVLLPGR
jgi:formylglycine-generating enzyme required for sulfatase activity